MAEQSTWQHVEFAKQEVGIVCKVVAVMHAADTLAVDIAAAGVVAGNAEVGETVVAAGVCYCRRKVDSSSARTETAGVVADTIGIVVDDLDSRCFAFAEFLQMLLIPGLLISEQLLAADIDRSLEDFVHDQRCLETTIGH